MRYSRNEYTFYFQKLIESQQQLFYIYKLQETISKRTNVGRKKACAIVIPTFNSVNYL